MKKYKVIKEYKTSCGLRQATGAIVREHANEDFNKFLILNGFMEEINEGPKFKVGDYAVENGLNEFMQIYGIKFRNNEFTYNSIYEENELRKPTEEELKKYFR